VWCDGGVHDHTVVEHTFDYNPETQILQHDRVIINTYIPRGAYAACASTGAQCQHAQAEIAFPGRGL
jgi:hypothetical protein